MGVGVYAADSAIFHLFTHAFFKALLFLGAGSVMHAMGGIIDMRHFGGLRKILPFTFVTFLIGSLALAGVPVFTRPELWVMLRQHEPGEKLEAEYGRNGERGSASAVL